MRLLSSVHSKQKSSTSHNTATNLVVLLLSLAIDYVIQGKAEDYIKNRLQTCFVEAEQEVGHV
jgi:hypothetical protein